MVAATRIQLSEPGHKKVIINLVERNNTVTIGNAPISRGHIRLQSQNPYISRFHCTITRVDDKIYIRDGALLTYEDKPNEWRHSTKGTYINDDILEGDEPHELLLSDSVCLGDPADALYTGYRITVLADETQNDLTSTQGDIDNAAIVRACATESLTRNECGVLGLEALPMGLGTRIRYTDSSAELNLGFEAGELTQTLNEIGLEQILARSEAEQVISAIETSIAQGRLTTGTYDRMTGGKVMLSFIRKLLDADSNRYYIMVLVYGIERDKPTMFEPGSTVEPSGGSSDKSTAANVTDRLLAFIDKRPAMGWSLVILWGITISLITVAFFI